MSWSRGSGCDLIAVIAIPLKHKLNFCKAQNILKVTSQTKISNVFNFFFVLVHQHGGHDVTCKRPIHQGLVARKVNSAIHRKVIFSLNF